MSTTNCPLDVASILLVNQAGWRKRFEALIKAGIDAGNLDQWRLKPREKSQLSKRFEPGSVSVAWSDNYELTLYINLEITAPIMADAPSSSKWYIKLNLELHCSWLEMEVGD